MTDTFDTASKDLISRIVSEPEWEVEWLDLLSQMEYVGFRKIVKSVDFRDVSLSVLQHLQEECLHSFLLKRLVARKKNEPCTWGKGPLSELGWSYFQNLDNQVCELLGSEEEFYPTVSWVIEQRVLTLYPIHYELTKAVSVKSTLEQILVQETRHGREFERYVPQGELRAQLLDLERELWKRFVDSALSLLGDLPQHALSRD